MPARIASGSVGQASMSTAKLGSIAGDCGPSAPHSALLGVGFIEFSGEFAVGSIPIHSRKPVQARKALGMGFSFARQPEPTSVSRTGARLCPIAPAARPSTRAILVAVTFAERACLKERRSKLSEWWP